MLSATASGRRPSAPGLQVQGGIGRDGGERDRSQIDQEAFETLSNLKAPRPKYGQCAIGPGAFAGYPRQAPSSPARTWKFWRDSAVKGRPMTWDNSLQTYAAERSK